MKIFYFYETRCLRKLTFMIANFSSFVFFRIKALRSIFFFIVCYFSLFDFKFNCFFLFERFNMFKKIKKKLVVKWKTTNKNWKQNDDFDSLIYNHYSNQLSHENRSNSILIDFNSENISLSNIENNEFFTIENNWIFNNVNAFFELDHEKSFLSAFDDRFIQRFLFVQSDDFNRYFQRFLFDYFDDFNYFTSRFLFDYFDVFNHFISRFLFD